MNGPTNVEVHEALLYGASHERIGWVYADLKGAAQSQLKLGAENVTLRAQVQDPLAVPGSLSVNGAATYRAKSGAIGRQITLSGSVEGGFTVQANGNLSAVYYTDGAAWYKLTGTLPAGNVVRASAQPNTALRGAGQLTDGEADALGKSLQHQGQLAVAVVQGADLPDPKLNVEPAPSAYLRTGLYVQGGVTAATAQSVATPSGPSVATPSGPSSAPAVGGLSARQIASGSNAAVDDPSPSVSLATSQAELSAVWQLAHGRQTPVPSPPAVDLTSTTIVTFFLGQKPTGGYGARLISARAEGATLYLTLEIRQPGPGTITTQALTSPWLTVSVAGTYTRVVVQDAAGKVVAQN